MDFVIAAFDSAREFFSPSWMQFLAAGILVACLVAISSARPKKHR